MKKIKLNFNLLAVLVIVFSFNLSISAQSGGAFSITQSVIAGGGNTGSGGNFSLTGTTGQAIAGGQESNPPYSIRNGFWAETFAPTAATLSVAGRVVTANGRGIRNVRLTLTGMNNTSRTINTGPFGYFVFDELEAGQTYILTVSAKRFHFAQPTLVFTIVENLDDIIFTALE